MTESRFIHWLNRYWKYTCWRMLRAVLKHLFKGGKKRYVNVNFLSLRSFEKEIKHRGNIRDQSLENQQMRKLVFLTGSSSSGTSLGPWRKTSKELWEENSDWCFFYTFNLRMKVSPSQKGNPITWEWQLFKILRKEKTFCNYIRRQKLILIMVIILQYIQISKPYVVHLKLT